jgi:HAD superfamily hydrolase (TIGR01509 family)
MVFSFKGLKGVIFDLDETLIDSLEVYTEALNQGTRILGLKPVEKQEVAYLLDRGLRLGEILASLFPQNFTEEVPRRQCQEEIRRWYLQTGIEKVELKPGVKPVLQALKGMGFKIGIVTGRMTQKENKWLELQKLGIAEFIGSLVTASEAAPKPAPDGLIKCLHELGLSPGECIFIGDSRVDVMAGKAAGLKTVALHGGISDRNSLAELKPDYILPDLDSLLFYLTEQSKYEKL